VPETGHPSGEIRAAWRAYRLWLGLALLALGFGMLVWLVVLQRLPVGIAYPMLSLNFVWVTLAAKAFWRECGAPLAGRRVHHVGIILLGGACVRRLRRRVAAAQALRAAPWSHSRRLARFSFFTRCGILHRVRVAAAGADGVCGFNGLLVSGAASSGAQQSLCLAEPQLHPGVGAALCCPAGEKPSWHGLGALIYYRGADDFSADVVDRMDQRRNWQGRANGKAQGADLAVAYRMEGAGSTVDAHYLPGVRATLFDDGAFTRPDTPEHGKLTLVSFSISSCSAC
jgi:hypothetical protein